MFMVFHKRLAYKANEVNKSHEHHLLENDMDNKIRLQHRGDLRTHRKLTKDTRTRHLARSKLRVILGIRKFEVLTTDDF